MRPRMVMLVVRVHGMLVSPAEVMALQQACLTLSRLWRLPALMMVVTVVSGFRCGDVGLLECAWDC